MATVWSYVNDKHISELAPLAPVYRDTESEIIPVAASQGSRRNQ